MGKTRYAIRRQCLDECGKALRKTTTNQSLHTTFIKQCFKLPTEACKTHTEEVLFLYTLNHTAKGVCLILNHPLLSCPPFPRAYKARYWVSPSEPALPDQH